MSRDPLENLASLEYISETAEIREFKFGTQLHLEPSQEVTVFFTGIWPRSRGPCKIWHTLEYVFKAVKLETSGLWKASPWPLSKGWCVMYLKGAWPQCSKARDFKFGRHLRLDPCHQNGV